MNNQELYWNSVSRYLNSRILIEELAEVLEDDPNELDVILERFEELKALNTLHSFILKTGLSANKVSGCKFEKGSITNLFCRSIGVQLGKMDFEDIRKCYDNFVW